MSKLGTMFWGDSNLPDIPNQVFGLSELSFFGVRRNNIEVLPTEIGNTRIQYLNLEKNKLTYLPTQIGEAQQLDRLHIGENNISVLPTEVGKLDRLTSLNITGTRITKLTLPESFAALNVLDSGTTTIEFLPPLEYAEHLINLNIASTMDSLRSVSAEVEAKISSLRQGVQKNRATNNKHQKSTTAELIELTGSTGLGLALAITSLIVAAAVVSVLVLARQLWNNGKPPNIMMAIPEARPSP